MEKIQVVQQSEIAWVRINREAKRNAIDYETMEQLDRALSLIEEDNNVKVLVITGAGNQAFCSGGDLSVFHELETKKQAEQMLTKMGNILYKLFFYPKPTIAAINGTAIGGGCEIATACDFRLAAPHAKMGFVQGTLAITTGWGASTMLYERLPQPTAMQMLMTCRRYTAEEAKALHFVVDIIDSKDFLQGCEEWLSPFLQTSGSVLKAYKKRWMDKYNKAEMKKRFFQEIDECSTLWESQEHHDAVQRFLKKS